MVLANVLINSAVDYLDMLGNFVEVDLGAALVAAVRSRVLRDDLASELDCFETILQKRRGKRVPLKAGEAFRCTNRSRRRWRRTHSLWRRGCGGTEQSFEGGQANVSRRGGKTQVIRCRK